MQNANCFRSLVSAPVLAIALVLLAVGACSEDPEEKLRDAGKQLDAVQKTLRGLSSDSALTSRNSNRRTSR